MSIDLPDDVVRLRTSLQRVLISASEIFKYAEQAKWELERSGRHQASELPGRTPGDPQWASYGDVSRRMPLIVDINDDDPNAEALRASNEQEQREFKAWRNREATYGWPHILDRLQESAIEFWNHWQSANDALSALPQKTHDILDKSTGGPWMVMVRRTLDDVAGWPDSSKPQVFSDGTFPVTVEALVTKVEKDGLPDWNNAFTSLRGYDDDLRALWGYDSDGEKAKAAVASVKRRKAQSKPGRRLDETKHEIQRDCYNAWNGYSLAMSDEDQRPLANDEFLEWCESNSELPEELNAKEIKRQHDVYKQWLSRNPNVNSDEPP